MQFDVVPLTVYQVFLLFIGGTRGGVCFPYDLARNFTNVAEDVFRINEQDGSLRFVLGRLGIRQCLIYLFDG